MLSKSLIEYELRRRGILPNDFEYADDELKRMAGLEFRARDNHRRRSLAAMGNRLLVKDVGLAVKLFSAS
jgi:hypothetical protein